MGANDSVTALYELVPAHGDESARTLRYQGERELTAQAAGDELATVSVRYQAPQGSASELLSMDVPGHARPLAQTSDSFRFAAAVAGFGMLLRESPHAGNASLGELRNLASTSLADDPHGDRRELVALIDRARSLRRD
jgi:Ca-activated chloride channel family protein